MVGDQNTDIHPVRDFLGAETLEILADGCVGLAKAVGFI